MSKELTAAFGKGGIGISEKGIEISPAARHSATVPVQKTFGDEIHELLFDAHGG